MFLQQGCGRNNFSFIKGIIAGFVIFHTPDLDSSIFDYKEKERKNKMNVFMPCESISESIQALDDARLRKQILECKVLLEGAIAYQNGEKPNGYFKHPVAQHYKEHPVFLWLYGYECCKEFFLRFDKFHEYLGWFEEIYSAVAKNKRFVKEILYAEGRKDTPECIRTTDPDKVYDSFKQKLIKKWKADAEKGRPPKWTNRGMPEWAKGGEG